MSALPAISPPGAAPARAVLSLHCEPQLPPADKQHAYRLHTRLAKLVTLLDTLPPGSTEARENAAALRLTARDAGAVIQAVLAPLLLTGLEQAVEKASAPFFLLPGDGAALARQTEAWAALEAFLSPEKPGMPLPTLAQWALDTLGAVLAGSVKWEHEAEGGRA